MKDRFLDLAEELLMIEDMLTKMAEGFAKEPKSAWKLEIADILLEIANKIYDVAEELVRLTDELEGSEKEGSFHKEARIVKKKGKWCVESEKTGRSFGCYDTKEEAEKRLRQIEYFKHKKGQ